MERHVSEKAISRLQVSMKETEEEIDSSLDGLMQTLLLIQQHDDHLGSLNQVFSKTIQELLSLKEILNDFDQQVLINQFQGEALCICTTISNTLYLLCISTSAFTTTEKLKMALYALKRVHDIVMNCYYEMKKLEYVQMR